MFAFIKKEFYHIFRDVRSMVILFGMPLAMVLLFGFAITNDITNAKIAVLDNSKDVNTKQIIQKLLSSGYFILEDYLDDPNEIEKVFTVILYNGQIWEFTNNEVTATPNFTMGRGRNEV